MQQIVLSRKFGGSAMRDDPTSRDAFEAATDRREYEKTRLPPVLKRKVEHLDQKAEQDKAHLAAEQEAKREQDLAEERARLRLEHPTKTYEDLSADGVRKTPSNEEIERAAVHAIDRRNALSLAGIDLERDAKVDKVLALGRQEDSQDRTQGTPDLLSAKACPDIGRDFFRAGGPER